MINIICSVFIGALLVGSPLITPPAADSEEQQLVDKARITFQSFMSDSNMDWLKSHLKEAKGVLIVPSLFKDGKPASPVDILVTHSVSNSGSAELRKTVANAAKK